MQVQNQSASVSLGQNTTPSSLICYPEEKTFYATVNSSGKSFGSALSIIDFEEVEQSCKLTHRSVPYTEYLEKCMFLKDVGLLLSTNTNSGQATGLAMLTPQAKQIKPLKAFTQSYNNVMTSKQGEILLATPKEIAKYDTEKDTLSPLLPVDGPCLSYINPNNSNTFLCGYLRENRIGIYDRLSKTYLHCQYRPPIRIENAHNSKPLSFDFNPSKPNYFMACYHDCMKFWDLKKPNLPMKCVDLHHSMLLNAKYNFYDEHMLDDDGTLGLFRMTSISSAATSVSGSSKEQDGLVKLYDDHEDSTYQICWAGFSPWYFASISYGSNLVVNSVPSSEKHRILF